MDSVGRSGRGVGVAFLAAGMPVNKVQGQAVSSHLAPEQSRRGGGQREMRSAGLAGRACDARSGIQIGFLVCGGVEQEWGWWHDVITSQLEEGSVGDETRGGEIRGVCLEERKGPCQEEGAGRAEGSPGGGRLAFIFRDPG